MRVGGRDAERLRVSRPHSHLPQCAHWGTFPPERGRLWVRSNGEEFGPLWDVWIHILGIGAKCACWKAGGPVYRPYGGNVVSPGGAPCRVVCGRRAGEDTRPYGDCGRKTVGAHCAPLHRIYERLYIQEEGQVWDLSLKTQRRSGASQKVLLLTFLSRKVRGSGGKPEPLTCVCCKGEGEMGDMYDYWVR